MPLRSARRFTLVDAMILIAAVAVGLAGVRAGWGLPEPTVPFSVKREPIAPVPVAPPAAVGWVGVLGRLGPRCGAGVPVAACLAVGLLVVRLRRPDRGPGRLFRLPGMVGGLSVLGVIALVPVAGLVRANLHAAGLEGLLSNVILRPVDRLANGLVAPVRVGLVVPALWAGLAPFRWWRGEPGCIDRAGVVTGAIWAGLLLIGWSVA